jgi:hypothetical protein
MNKTKPTRPTRVNKKAEEVVQPVEEEVTPLTENKYAPKKKVGTASLRNATTVTTVGLGNLEVITANGYTDV